MALKYSLLMKSLWFDHKYRLCIGACSSKTILQIFENASILLPSKISLCLLSSFFNHSHTKKDTDTEIRKKVVLHCSLVSNGCSADFLFDEDLEAILCLVESDTFDESLESASMVTETSSKIQTEEPEAHFH